MTHARDSRLTKEQKDARQEQRARHERELALLRKDMDETFAPAHGQRVLKWLMDQCGYQRPSTSVDPNSTKILIDNVIYNEARRNLYLSLRRLIKTELLIRVENKPNSDGEASEEIFD